MAAPKPIEVWTWPAPNGHKVHIALEELGLFSLAGQAAP